MKIQTSELLKILNVLKPGLTTKEFVVQATHYLFTGDTIATYNDRICISYPFHTDFVCSVRSTELIEIIGSVKEAEVDITLKDNKLKVVTPTTKAQLSATLDPMLIDLVHTLKLGDLQWTELPTKFKDGIFLCMFSASKDVSLKHLATVGVSGNTIVSSDNVRVSRYTLDTPLNATFLLPQSCATELVKFNICEYCIQDSWAHFLDNNDVTFSCRISLATYPDVASFFDVDSNGIELVFPEGTKDLVDSLLVMADGQFTLDKSISVTIENNVMVCRSEKQLGYLEKSLPITYNGDPLQFAINPIFFSQVLDKATVMQMFDDRALFTSGNFSHIMALPI